MRGLAFGALLLVLGCSTYKGHLERGQRLYQKNDYNAALAVWRVLEPDMDSLSDGDRTRYAYLRGMTDFRLGYRDDARHWLAIAKALETAHPGGLSGDWPKRVDAALAELNREIYGLEKEAPEAPANIPKTSAVEP